MKIISRKAWGAEPWNGQPYSTPLNTRTHFLVHYHGGAPRHDRGDASAKEIESIHLANGWSGVGYNFMVGQDGEIREGRGWTLVGAHCPGHNRNGIGVYVAVGGDQEPTKEALNSVRWLYDEACRKTGNTLVKSWHGADYPTECPGNKLREWVKSGMQVDKVTTPAKRPNPTPTKVDRNSRTHWLGTKVKEHGKWSEGTIKRFQAELNVTIDGDDGPETWKAIQRWCGATPDGIRGPQTIRAMQKKLGVSTTGRWTWFLMIALQRYLNGRRRK